MTVVDQLPMRSPRTLHLCLLILGCLLASHGALAAAPPTLEMAVLADPSGEETITSVSQPDRAAEFAPSAYGLSAGYTRDVHWLRLRIDARGERRVLLDIQPPYLDDLQLYQPDGRGGFHLRRTGDIYNFDSRDLPTRGFVFNIDFATTQPQVLYLRVETTSSSLVLPRVFAPDDYVTAQSTEYLVLGLYYGVLAAVLILNLWSGQWRHDPEHRAFMIYALVVLGFMLSINGLLAQYVFPNAPAISHHAVSIFVITSVGAAAHFHRRILAINRDTPILNGVFLGGIVLSAISLIALWAGYFTEVAQPLTLIALLIPMLGILRTAILWQQGRTDSTFIALGYVLNLLAYVVTVLSVQGFIPGSQIQVYSFQIGSLLTLLSFNYALFIRMRNLKQLRDAAIEDARQARIAYDSEKIGRERQGALLAMLTHELKTPLAVVRLAIDRLTGDKRVKDHAVTAIADIGTVIDRCTYADRLDHGEIRVRHQPCQLIEILDECMTQTDQTSRIDWQIPETCPTVMSDQTLLRAICTNLLDNALKYGSPKSPVKVRVTSQARTDGTSGVTLEVANELGPAGAPDPKRLFQRYHREAAAHSQTGSGLGLYLSHQLAMQLGGELTYHPPDATDIIRFTLWLPLNSVSP